MQPLEKVGWRQRLVKWFATLMGVTVYPAPFQIVIYDMSGQLTEIYKAQRKEDEAVH